MLNRVSSVLCGHFLTFGEKSTKNTDFWTPGLKDPYPSGDSAPNQTRKASCLI